MTATLRIKQQFFPISSLSTQYKISLIAIETYHDHILSLYCQVYHHQINV